MCSLSALVLFATSESYKYRHTLWKSVALVIQSLLCSHFFVKFNTDIYLSVVQLLKSLSTDFPKE